MEDSGDTPRIAYREHLDWDQCEAAFQDEGALHDIYVRGTSMADWNHVLREIPQWNLPCHFSRGDESLPMPRSAEECFVRDERAAISLLTLDIGGIVLHCNFFSEEELELDYSPGDVCDQQRLDGILNFMQLLGDSLEKPVFLSSEGEHDHPIFRYCSETREFHYSPSTARRKPVHGTWREWLAMLFRMARRV